ncbi:MAG: valine--tRNA ligase [Rhodobacteraceae bacterium]|nr:valine--tRNA ligase [Paracoccaceae bacterium]
MTMDKSFDAATAEARISAEWLKAEAFAAGANAMPGAEPFSIMIPPPNVTGVLHMGHAFNNTLQDILIRWHRMRGFDTLWQPGMDHAGIATQMVVERELAKDKSNATRRDMGREAFTEKVWEWKKQSGGTIIEQLQRIGASCDWSRTAFTMSGAPGAPEGEEGNFHDAVIKVFVDMYDKGLIYRGKRLVNWDPKFETAISDLEVENIETPGHMWHFKYPLASGASYEYVEKDEDGKVTLRETRDYISIATTRPETMLGDGAVAVHPSDERYASIVGKLCEIPVGPKEYRRQIPIITDEYPDPAFGSGAVKITGAHDFNDYAVAERGGIPKYRLMDTQAAMRADGAPYAEAATRAQEIAGGAEATGAEIDTLNLVPDELRGLDRFEARDAVVEQITSEGLAVMVPENDPRLGKAARTPLPPEEGGDTPEAEMVPLVETKPIMQPFGDRSKVVIEPMLTDQWFVATDKIVGPAIDAVKSGDVRIMPEQHEKVYFHWLENIEPWCISRQLWWGHQIPVWYGPRIVDSSDGAYPLSYNPPMYFCANSADQAAKKANEYYGHNVQIEFSKFENLPALEGMQKTANPTAFAIGSPESMQLEKVVLARDPDVLDTWFSSGLWPIGTLGWPEETEEFKRYFPTSTLITGFDIIFFWVARMMMMQFAVVGQKPFSDVYVHALVRDEKGKKMSKSLGNVMDPLELIDEFGADAMRFALISMGRDLKLSKQRIAGYRNFGTKLWNAARFAEMNGVFGQQPGETPTPTHPVNRWIVGEVARTAADVDEALAAYRFSDAASTLYAFVWGRFCDWYVEFSKPLFDGEHAGETRQTMAWALDHCLLMLHPFMPFITEELWALSGKRTKQLVHGDWPELDASVADAEADAEISWVIALIEGIRSVRGEMNVPASLKAPLVRVELDAAGAKAWGNNAALITRMARLGDVTEGSAPKGSATIAVPGGSFALPLADIIDVGAEKARLSKTLEKLDKDLRGLSGRLNNPKFIDSAPEEVVEETRALATEKEAERARIAAAVERLGEVS